jgi:Fe-S-cluster containining protein
MSLCVTCGLCCDGTLFSTAPLEAGEAARLGDAVQTTVDGAALRQPCRALRGACCEVYEARPAVCRRFNCFVLHQLETGAVSEADADAFIDDVFARRRVVAEALGLEPPAASERAPVRAEREAWTIEGLELARKQAREGAASAETLAALERLSRLLLFMNLSA